MVLEYKKIKHLLDNANIEFSVAFVHGVLTAYACDDLQNNNWINIFHQTLDIDEEQKIAFRKLADNKEIIAKQLADADLNFSLLINESDDIKEQALSTRDWASGFWLGVKNTNLVKKIKDDDSIDFIEDIKRISAMPLPNSSDVESLDDLFQVQEYCRIGVIGIFLDNCKL